MILTWDCRRTFTGVSVGDSEEPPEFIDETVDEDEFDGPAEAPAEHWLLQFWPSSGQGLSGGSCGLRCEDARTGSGTRGSQRATPVRYR